MWGLGKGSKIMCDKKTRMSGMIREGPVKLYDS